MTRPDNHRAKPVRVNRIERLETRHMLSADGLSFADFHDGTWALAVSTGTTALETCLRVVGVEAGGRQPLPHLLGDASSALVVAHSNTPVTGSSVVLSRPSGSIRVIRRTRQRSSSRSGKSSRQWDPRVSSRRRACRARTLAI